MQSWLYSGFKPWLGSSLGFIRKLSYDLVDFLCNQKCSFLNNHLIFEKMWVYYFFNSHLFKYLESSTPKSWILPPISHTHFIQLISPNKKRAKFEILLSSIIVMLLFLLLLYISCALRTIMYLDYNYHMLLMLIDSVYLYVHLILPLDLV